MTERLFKQNGSTSGNLPRVQGLNKIDEPDEATDIVQSSKDFRLHRFDLNNRSDTNTKADRDSQPERRPKDDRRANKVGPDEMPYDLNEVSDLSLHFANGFDLLKKAIEFLAKKQRRTEGALQEHGMLPPPTPVLGEDGKPLPGYGMPGAAGLHGAGASPLPPGAPGTAANNFGLTVNEKGETIIIGKDGKPIAFNAKDLRKQVMQNTVDVADHEQRLTALYAKKAKQDEKLKAMFGDAFADSEEEGEGDPNDPDAGQPGGRSKLGVGNPFEARFQKMDKKIQTLTDALAATMNKKDRAKLLAGLAEADGEDQSLDGEESSRVSPDDSMSARSDRRGFNSLMLDFKEEHQHEMQAVWAAIKKLEEEKMDRQWCEKQLRKLKRKVEEELGSLGASTDPETQPAGTPGGALAEKAAAAERVTEAVRESKESDAPSGSKVSSRALQGADADALKAVAAQLPQLQSLVDEFSKLGGVAILSLMKEQIGELQRQNASTISRDEYNKIIAQGKITDNELRMAVSEINFFRKSLDQVRDDLYRLQKAPTEEEFLLMRTRIEAAENTISQLSKKVAEAQKAMKQLRTQFGKGGDQEGLAEQIERLSDQLQDHLHEYANYKDATKEELTDLRDALTRKADKGELDELQALLQRQLQDQIQMVKDGCASKEDTTRKLNQLSRKVKELFELVSGNSNVNEDGMLTKRHLGPNACASCDKTLVNMQGVQAEYSPHKKMPYREQADRIARYGAGFSKMLSTLQPSQSGVNLPGAARGRSPQHGDDQNRSAANLHFQKRQSPSQKNLQLSNPQLLTVFQKQQEASNNATSMRNQYQVWEEESHGLIPARMHPDHLRNQGAEQSTYQKISGGGPMNSTMLQTMHTMPAGIGAGQSGYGPGSQRDPAQLMGDNSNFKTSIGFFNNQNSGSTPINGQSNANQTHAQKQFIEKIEEQRKRHSSVVRGGQVAQGSAPYGVMVQHQPGASVGSNPADLAPINMALRMKRNARSPDQQLAGSDFGPGARQPHGSNFGVAEGRKADEADGQPPAESTVLPQLTQRGEAHRSTLE